MHPAAFGGHLEPWGGAGWDGVEQPDPELGQKEGGGGRGTARPRLLELPGGSRSTAGMLGMQLSAGQGLMGFLMRYAACFDTTGQTSSSLPYHNYGISDDKDLAVITPTELLYKPGALEGVWVWALSFF